MNLLYNAAIALYGAGARLAACRSDKAAKMVSGQKTALETLARVRKEKCPGGFDFWVHAASLGEFEQARPLIEAIRRSRPEATICLSFFSPSGYEVRKDYPMVDAVVYLPFDSPSKARTFVSAIAPHMAIFVKYEFWGNILSCLHEDNTPTYLISAIFRPGQAFFKPWGGQFRKMLRCYTHIFVQDENSRELLASIGIDNVTVAGDTRFDRVTDIMSKTVHIPAIEKWLADSPFTLVAGSSWPEDEQHYIPWVNDNAGVRLILAPHEFNEQRIQNLVSRFRMPVTRWSEIPENGEIPADTRILIIDSFGLLSSLYRYGHAALIGGGFGAGIHNINEAAVYGIPVVFGPNHHKFREALGLLECGGAYTYDSSRSLSAILDTLSKNPTSDNGASALTSNAPSRVRAGEKAAEYIKGNLGATRRILQAILPE